MSDGVPKSRVTLTYDTRQPEGREKPRELPFRLMVLGDLGGNKQDVPLESRRVRQLNGRNLGDVIKGLKIRVPDVTVGDNRKVNLLIDSMESFAPDDVLRTLTGQKHERPIDAALRSAWGESATPESLWPADPALAKTWSQREQVVGFQKSYQNSKTLRAALKAFSNQPANKEEADKRQKAIEDMKKQIAAKASGGGTTGSGGGGSTGSGGGGSATGATGTGPGARGGTT
jgi:uncharacterized membrane protein YgcG